MEILLVDIDREIDLDWDPDISVHLELFYKTCGSLTHRFHEAYTNLQKEIDQWSTAYNINIEVVKRHEEFVDRSCLDSGVRVSRKKTQVVARLSDEDMVILQLTIGKIRPANTITRTVDNKWCFKWEHN